MSDRHAEGIEKAAEAVGLLGFPAPEVTRELRMDRQRSVGGKWRDIARAAVSAYLGHTEVTTVEELDALPNHSVILCATDTVWRVATFPEGKQWISTTYAYSRPSGDINLPATVLHRPTP